MGQVEERYIFIFTPIHTKMTIMDVSIECSQEIGWALHQGQNG